MIDKLSLQKKILKQINHLNYSLSKIDLEIDCMQTDVYRGTLSVYIFNLRKEQLIKAKESLIITHDFLLDFYYKAGGKIDEFYTEKEVTI